MRSKKVPQRAALFGLTLLALDIWLKVVFTTPYSGSDTFAPTPYYSFFKLCLLPSSPVFLALFWHGELRRLGRPKLHLFSLSALVVGVVGGVFEFLHFDPPVSLVAPVSIQSYLHLGPMIPTLSQLCTLVGSVVLLLVAITGFIRRG